MKSKKKKIFYTLSCVYIHPLNNKYIHKKPTMFVDKLNRCKLCEIAQCLSSPMSTPQTSPLSTTIHPPSSSPVAPMISGHHQPPPIGSFLPNIRDVMITAYLLKGRVVLLLLGCFFFKEVVPKSSVLLPFKEVNVIHK